MTDASNSSDATGELSWPLVDRRRRRTEVPEGTERRRSEARLDDLTEANDLLHALQRLSLTLPATLDLDRMLDDAEHRIRGLLSPDRVFILLRPRHVDVLTPSGARRQADPDIGLPYRFLLGGRGDLALPAEIRPVLSLNRSRRSTFDRGTGLHVDSTSGVYSALRARGTIIGVVGVEWTGSGRDHDRSDDRAAELLTGIADALGLALDNALLFRTLRVSGADDERRRLAREVHDRTGSSLAAIGFELDHLTRRLAEGTTPDETIGAIRQARAHLDEAIADVREFLFDLRAEPGHEVGLDRLLRDFVEHIGRRSGIATLLEGEAPTLPLEFARQVWSIVREAILNAERHSGASSLRVSTTVTQGVLGVEITDDGSGFDVDAERTGRFGLVGMRERAALLTGSLEIVSGPLGTSVRVSARIPGPTGDHP